MDNEKLIGALRSFYIAAQADACLRYARGGILEQVEADKGAELAATGTALARRLELARPEAAFTKLQEIFDCARWSITPQGQGFTAVATACRLCAAVQSLQGPSPCRLFCLGPIEAMIRSVDPLLGFEVQGTLWAGHECRVLVVSSPSPAGSSLTGRSGAP